MKPLGEYTAIADKMTPESFFICGIARKTAPKFCSLRWKPLKQNRDTLLSVAYSPHMSNLRLDSSPVELVHIACVVPR